MTPHERQLITELFDRLAALENTPRDQDAERAIGGGLNRAPNAVYALVQTVLVQDEALKIANTHIQELEAAAQAAPSPGTQQPSSFLDTARDTVLGRRGVAPGGSVPTVRPGGVWGTPPSSVWGNTSGFRGGMVPPPPAMQPPSPMSAGGSFLGTAAAAAAGMIGGGLMLDGIRSMLGTRQQAPFAGPIDQPDSPHSNEMQSPWGSNDHSNLAQQAGLDDMTHDRAGLLDNTTDDVSGDATDFGDSGSDGGSDGA